MGLKSPKSEVCKAIHDRLTIVYSTLTIPVYVDIAPKVLGNDTHILIWGWVESESGTKNNWGYICSVNVEIYTKSDDSVKHNSIVNSVKSLIHTKKVEHLTLSTFYNSVLKEPSSQFIVELNEDGQTQRTILKYELNVEQINN